VHFHGYDAHNLAVLKKQQSGYRELGKTASAVIAVSNAMVESLVVNGIPREKISLLRCGVDETRFPAKSDFPTDPLFFAVGRFTDKKAPYLTLLAFKQVLEAHPNARLIMAGEGELWETTRNLSAALDIDFAVSFPGVITPEEVSSWMGRATAFVQHSIAPLYGPSAGDSEGTPVAVLEALVSGLPVISTRHTGIGDVVDNGQSGFLVDERDVDGMAAAMVRLCGSREEAITMGARARKDALSKYTASHYIDSLRQVLQRCGTADIE
jgi:glycosyltransferase involved in cell wall biosynthesis